MRQLHVLGTSEDGTSLLLATTKTATKAAYKIPLDDKIRAAAQGRLAPFGSDRAESALTPKEMQARMREGATPEEVAKAAGVPVARVLPYFAPVEAERERIVEQARLVPMQRSRGPASTKPLGLVVDAHLLDVGGFKPDSVTWTASRRPRDGAWIVSVSYDARGRRQAEWLWKPTTRELTPLDANASRLGTDAAARQAAARIARKTARKAAAKKAKKAIPPRTQVAAVPVKPVKTSEPVKAPEPVKAAEPPVKRVKAIGRAAPEEKPVRRRPRAVPPVSTEPEFEPDVIPLPVTPLVPVALHEPEPEPEADEVGADEADEVAETPQPESKPARKPGQRVPLPSWDDVLLGATKSRNRRSG